MPCVVLMFAVLVCVALFGGVGLVLWCVVYVCCFVLCAGGLVCV